MKPTASLKESVSPPFAELSLVDWKALCPSLKVLEQANKTVIYHQGDVGEHVYVLLKGRVKLLRLTQSGEERVTEFLTRGEIFGALSMADNEAEETVVAVGETQLGRISQQDFNALLTQRPALALQLIEILSQRRRTAERKLESVLFDDALQRLLKTLLDLSRRFGGTCSHGYAVEVYFTQQEIADLAGISRPVTSTLLNDLKEQKLLDFSKEAVCYMDKEIFARILSA